MQASGSTQGESMRKLLTVCAFFLVVSLLGFTNLIASEQRNAKIKRCLKEKECRFIITDPATPDPKMSFLVFDRVWKGFTDGDKNYLREVLKKKIKEARGRPEKYIRLSKKSSSYDTIKKNIRQMRSYSVVISYSKTRRDDLRQDEMVLVNY